MRTLVLSVIIVVSALFLIVPTQQANPVLPASMPALLSCSDVSAGPTVFVFPAQGGSNEIGITNPTGCSWAVNNLASFITVTAINTNNPGGYVRFSVASNPGGPRNGVLRIVDSSNPDGPGPNIQVYQDAATVPLYRYWNPSTYNHFYTTNFSELGNGANGYNFERIECRVLPNPVSGAFALKRYYCAENGDHFYTTNPSEPGSGLPCYQFERIECYVYNSPVQGAVPLYRYYEPNAYDHFYTTDFSGNGIGGWYLEGVQCYVFPR